MGVTTSTTNAGATYVPIATNTLSSSASSVTFSSIPQTYTDLVLVSNHITASGSGEYTLFCTFNGDTISSGSSYSYTYLFGGGSSTRSDRTSNYPIITMAAMFQQFGNGIFTIMNYSNNTTYKTTLLKDGQAGGQTWANVGLYRSTSPITSITLTNGTVNIGTGSTFTLYGIRGA